MTSRRRCSTRDAGRPTLARCRALARSGLWTLEHRLPAATLDALAAILARDAADADAIVERCQRWRPMLRAYLDAGGRLDASAPLPPGWPLDDGTAPAA